MKFVKLKSEMLDLLQVLEEYESFLVDRRLMDKKEFEKAVINPLAEEFEGLVDNIQFELDKAKEDFREIEKYADLSVMDYVKMMMNDELEEDDELEEEIGLDDLVKDAEGFIKFMMERGFNNDER